MCLGICSTVDRYRVLPYICTYETLLNSVHTVMISHSEEVNATLCYAKLWVMFPV